MPLLLLVGVRAATAVSAADALSVTLTDLVTAIAASVSVSDQLLPKVTEAPSISATAATTETLLPMLVETPHIDATVTAVPEKRQHRCRMGRDHRLVGQRRPPRLAALSRFANVGPAAQRAPAPTGERPNDRSAGS